MKTILIASTFLLIAMGIAQTANAQKWIKISKKDYTIKSPVDWSIDSSRQMGTDLVLFSMFESGTDKFRENVNVQIKNLSGANVNFTKYIASVTGQIKNMSPDAKIEESTTSKTGGISFQKIIYTATQGGLKLKFEQYNFLANNISYAITLTTEIAKFEVFKPIGEEILNSFQLK